jgi:chromosomal replication initiation ATPase DnaA
VREWLSTVSGFEPQKYLEKISELSGYTADEIVGDSRYAPLIKPRRLYWACLRNIGNLSYPEIGDLVGRDHTTVMRGIPNVPHSVVEALRKIIEG